MAPPREAPFWAVAHGPLLTLLFGDTRTQHAALARMECFYESEEYAGQYLTLAAARDARVCRGYEAYNMPVSAIAEWLDAMRAAQQTDAGDVRSVSATAAPSWAPTCSAEEGAVLAELEAHGAVLSRETSLEAAPPAPPGAPTYLIAAAVALGDRTLAHERLHALYHFSPTYRALLAAQWATMPRAVEAAVQYDLKMRGYRESVWQDELGAYLGVRVSPTSRRDDPANEFGAKSADACRAIRHVLLAEIPHCWRTDVGVDEGALVLSSETFAQARAALRPPAPVVPRPPAPRRGRKRNNG
ncbi:enhancer of mRNA decapping [Malassezia sp. CBS 17886]|nr:enhancer of mRNA decapping [Malassezia sp. CBS 17886]